MVDQGLVRIFSHAAIANLILDAPARKTFCRRGARIPATVVFKSGATTYFRIWNPWRSDDYAIRSGYPRQL